MGAGLALALCLCLGAGDELAPSIAISGFSGTDGSAVT